MIARHVKIDPWRPYVPSADAPWNLARVVHLHRRAGFGPTWREVQRDLQAGPEASIRRLLEGRPRIDGQPDDATQLAERLTDTAIENNDIGRLQAAWVYRMLFGKDPLRERLALLWHDHFATSYIKVESVARMEEQNRLFRKHARAPFGDLLADVIRNPALLYWLDAPSNRKAHPNENLARELMELFTLGVGHYTESDVKESARALTGWTVEGGAFTDNPLRHDGAPKTILGKKGRFRAPDLVKMLLAHPATAHRLADRLCRLFMGEGVIDGATRDALANRLIEGDLDIGSAVETILQSEIFFATPNIATRITDPASYVIGLVRALELFDPPPSTLLLARWMDRIGLDLYNPPNVGGWPDGRGWLSSRTLVARFNFAHAAISGEEIGLGRPLDPISLARRHGAAPDLASLGNFVARLLHGRSIDATTSERLVARAARAQDPPRQILLSVLTLPQTHLG